MREKAEAVRQLRKFLAPADRGYEYFRPTPPEPSGGGAVAARRAGFFRILSAEDGADGRDTLVLRPASRAAAAGIRLGDLRRRWIDPRTHPRDGRSHPSGNGAGAGGAPDLRRRPPRGDRRGGAAVLGGRDSPHRRLARRSTGGDVSVRAASERLPLCRRSGRRVEAGGRLRHFRRRLSGDASGGAEPAGRHRQSQAQDRRRRQPGDHSVLLRRRSLLPLSRSGARRRHSRADHPRHSTRDQLRASMPVLRHVRRLPAAVDGRFVRRARQRPGNPEAGRRLARLRAVPSVACGRGRAVPLLHAEQGRTRAGDLPRAGCPPESRRGSGAAGGRRSLMITDREQRLASLAAALQRRIVVLDGAMGTMIQKHRLEEADYRGERFRDWPRDLKGNNDLLSLTQPDLIRGIHRLYLEAGADIIETNTFNSNRISLADYGQEAFAREFNVAGATLARQAADAMTERTPDKPRLVAGAIGPTNRTASISPDVGDPGFRNIGFDELAAAYREAAEGLIVGGCDLILIETVFDTLNAKAALYAVDELFEQLGVELPVMVSGTITDLSGRNLSGQTAEALWNSVRHVRPLTIGLNCALGAAEMRPHIAELSRVADTYICAYPNAGLPNEFGEYDETPEMTAAHIRAWAEAGLVNVVGGCCGTTPEHIAAIAKVVEGVTPRRVPEVPRMLRLSGLEPFSLAS